MSTLKYYDQQSGTWKFLTTGERGPVGPIGPGVPNGGTTDQVIKKNSNADQDSGWATLVKADVGLSNVDNTSDANKPISTATQNALNLKEDKANKGVANGYASLGADAKLLPSQLPALALVDTYVVASQAAMLALSAKQGDVAIRTDLNKTFILSNNTPTVLVNWKEMLTPADSVSSVNGRVGAVTGLAENSDLLAHTGNASNPHSTTKSQVGLANVDNTSDMDKPVSTAQGVAIAAKLDKVSSAGTTRIYTVNGVGAQTMETLTSAATAWTVAQRDGAGAINTATPTAAAHATTKLYVDTQNALYMPLAGGNFTGNVGTLRLAPVANLTYDLGTASLYYLNSYVGRQHFNSTAYLDGATAGTIEASGRLYANYPGTLIGSTETSYALRVRNSGGISLTLGTDAAGGYIQSFASMPLRLNGVGNNVTFGANQGINTLVGFQTNSPTHTITLATTATGIALYNTVDQTTNYERVRQYWSGNNFILGSEAAGTGSVRTIRLSSSIGAGYLELNNSVSDFIRSVMNSGNANSTVHSINGTQTASSGVQYGLKVLPTINQSGTAGYTAILANVAETSTGSGAKNLMDLQVGGSSRFRVSNTGATSIIDGTQGTGKVLTSDASGNASWQTLDKTAVGLSNVDNTSDLDKPISIDTQNALDLKADLASPALTGIPTAPTATLGTNTTQLATTAFVLANAESPITASNGLTRTGDDIQLGGTISAGDTAYIIDSANGLEFSLIGSSDGIAQDASVQISVGDSDQAAILEMQTAYAQISHANYPSSQSATVATSGDNIAITSIDGSTTNIINVDANGIALNGILVDTDEVVSNVDAVQFNMTPVSTPAAGQLNWNPSEGVLNMGTDFSGATIQLGMESIVRVRNNTGSTILNGQVVYVDGALGNRPTVELADADIAPTALSILGVATADFDDNTDGAITTEGIVRDLDTSGYSEGDVLYLSGTAGELTTTPPVLPQTTVKVAIVTRSHITQGEILVRPYVIQTSGGSGITRSIVTTSGNVTAGATASTDYVYIITGAHTVTLPTAVGNTNKYDLNNASGSPVSLAFTSGQTANGGGVTLGANESITLISDNANWRIL